jgi:hypothetical protein
MKNLILLFLIAYSALAKAVDFNGLTKLKVGATTVFFSEGEDVSAQFSGELCDEANTYFYKTLSEIEVPFRLLVLSEEDWPTFAMPQAIYGMPHYLSDGKTLVVAAEDNFFWQRQLPDFNTLSAPFKDLFPAVYQINGKVTVRYFFDLLAVHELGHAWHWVGRLNTQRKWLAELFCNIMLHTFIETKRPEFVSALITLPAYWAMQDASGLAFTTLEQFESDYNNIGMKNPFNYAWYQYRFHHAAKLIFNEGGEAVMMKLWAFLQANEETLSDADLRQKLGNEVHPYFFELIDSW